MSEKESMERMNDHALDLIRIACEQGGNSNKARIAALIINERKRIRESTETK